MRILLTGATGFVGTGFLARLRQQPGTAQVRAVTRKAPPSVAEGIEWLVCADLDDDVAIARALQNVDVVVHAAARAHVMKENTADPLAEFRKVNRDGALTVAAQAARLGVRRFVFLSSVKVNGEETALGSPYRADDPRSPADPYGIAKAEAERGLLDLAKASRMNVVIIRPPLVYGPGVKGNFASMMKALCRGVPLPLGAIDNRRSLVSLANLTDLIVTCLEHPAASNQTFLVSDGEDLSTPELLRRSARALGCTARLLSVPTAVIKASATVLGKRHLARRLCSSLQVDIAKNDALLGWRPRVSVDAALVDTARAFLSSM